MCDLQLSYSRNNPAKSFHYREYVLQMPRYPHLLYAIHPVLAAFHLGAIRLS